MYKKTPRSVCWHEYDHTSWRKDTAALTADHRLYSLLIMFLLQALKALVIETGNTEFKYKIWLLKSTLYYFQKNHLFSRKYSSLPLRPTQFVIKERHITDMSSIRKKIKEACEITRETCGRATKIAMFA